MTLEHEFTEQHKDSFVRSGPQGGAKPAPGQKAPAQPAQPAQTAPAAPAAPKPPAAPKSGEQQIDDMVPEKVGNMVDNVFGKLDNLVNDAADYLFGNKPKKAGGLLEGDAFSKTPGGVPPLAKAPQAPPPIPKPELKPLVTPTAPAAPQPPVAKAAPAKGATPVRTLSTLQSSRKPEMIRPVMPESKPKAGKAAAAKFDGPVIARTTSISELDLPLEILDDPDLPRYFDQMKLYESQAVNGGLCNLPLFEASSSLRRGKWKHAFDIKFEDLKALDPGIYPMEMAKSRFFGMRPVYKAQAYRFSTREALLAAIQEDINAYLKGKQGQGFHPFIYQVVSTVIR